MILLKSLLNPSVEDAGDAWGTEARLMNNSGAVPGVTLLPTKTPHALHPRLSLNAASSGDAGAFAEAAG